MSGADLSVLIIGAGSIGGRHARNLMAAGAMVSITDPRHERAQGVQGARFVPFREGEWGGYNGIVVASPTICHVDHASAALACGAKVLVEKPLASTSEAADKLIDSGDGSIMVGFNLRLHEPVQRFVGLVQEGAAGQVSSVRAWFGSWLPDWRPNVDYRTSYSARRDLGGGVLLDAIHELDLLCWLMGTPLVVVGALVERLGPLEIDVEDTVKALLVGPTKDGRSAVGELSLDYLSRGYRRGIEVVGDRATIRLDWNRQVIEIENGRAVESIRADENLERSYEREATRFLDWIRDGTPPPVDGVSGASSLRLADEIREKARTSRHLTCS